MKKNFVKYNNYTLLPIVEYTEGFFSKDHLKNVYVIACQHILPSTHLMIRSMINLGLDINRIGVIGKCYSTSNATMQNMLDEGIFVCDSSNKFDSDLSFDEQFRASVATFLQSQIIRMKPDKNSTIVILDDGGELIYMAQDLAKFYPNIFGVEQTSSGYHKLANIDSRFPVKNVALSSAKLSFESPLIGKSVVYNLEKKLSLSSAEPKEILIVGNGSIGKEVAALLKTKPYAAHVVSTYDIITEKSDLDYLDFSSFDLIIGATGTKMFTYHYYDLLKKTAILVSVSSSDREFDGVHFRQLSGKTWKTHDDVSYNGLRLLNCGFPLNFSSSDNMVSIPLDKMQFVSALLFLGVCDLNTDKNESFMKLNKEHTESIFKQYSLMSDNE